MRTVAFDISPLESKHCLRGVGFYTKKLYEYFEREKELLLKKGLRVVFFERGKIPRKADLVHYPFFDPFFLTLPFFKTRKRVVTVHDLIPLIFPDKYPKGIRGEIKWQIQKRLLKSGEGIITDSESSKRDICGIIGYPKERIFRVYLAAGERYKKLTKGSWEKETREKYKLGEEFIVYVGDINYNKNVKGLLEEYKEVKSRGSRAKLVLVGGAFLERELKEAIEIRNLVESLDLKKEVVFTGQVGNDDLVKIYNLATIYVQPSFYEGFGLPVLEAMGCGCPVLSSKKSSLAEIGGEAVLYFNPEKKGEMARKIEKLLGDDFLRKKIANKGIRQSRKFSWEKTFDETIKVYKKFF